MKKLDITLRKRIFKLYRFSIIFLAITNLINHSLSYADEVDDFVKREMDERKIPGLQLAVIKDKKIIKLASYGFANLQDNIPVVDNTVFTLNSITKAFVGVAIMQLVEDEKIKLSDPPSLYIKDLPQSWADTNIKQLLSHTSGLPEIMSHDGKLISDKGEEASWRLVKSLPLNFEPNTQFQYNNTNYLLLGKIINEVSGMYFEDFIIEYQLKKVNMQRTIEAGFSHTENVISNQARNYTYYKTGKLTNLHEEFPKYLRTVAGMSSNANEIANWIISLQSGKLLNKSSLQKLWTPMAIKNGEIVGFNQYLNGYALGWPIVKRSIHPAVAAAGGNRSLLMIYPNDDLSIIVLSNLMAGIPVGANPETMLDEIAKFYVPQFNIQ